MEHKEAIDKMYWFCSLVHHMRQLQKRDANRERCLPSASLTLAEKYADHVYIEINGDGVAYHPFEVLLHTYNKMRSAQQFFLNTEAVRSVVANREHVLDQILSQHYENYKSLLDAPTGQGAT